MFLNLYHHEKNYFHLICDVYLGACSSDSAQKVTEKIKNAYSDGLRKTFIEEGVKSCIENSGLKESEAREYCECAMNKLNESLSNDEIVDISMDNPPKDLDERVDKAIDSCIGE